MSEDKTTSVTFEFLSEDKKKGWETFQFLSEDKTKGFLIYTQKSCASYSVLRLLVLRGLTSSISTKPYFFWIPEADRTPIQFIA